MRDDFWFDSQGAGKIHCCRWTPEGEPKAVLQIVHGIAEFIERYDDFAQFMTRQGYVVVAEDHMGHGQSINGEGIQGYFHGGWFAAVADTYHLLERTKRDYPGLPYILFGHSMGSFMARTILCQYPDSGIDAAIISGTCWQPAFAMPAIVKLMEAVCGVSDERKPNDKLTGLVFGPYNAKVEHPRTSLDWVSRDARVVDDHPMNHGFKPTAGLLRDMMKGIHFIEQPGNLAGMRRNLPVFLIAGGDDPVGSYGKGVRQTAKAFEKAGMQDVSVRIYPLCRHEILNEINKEEIYEDVVQWAAKKIGKETLSV